MNDAVGQIETSGLGGEHARPKAVIISTLILASVFSPVRKWLESIVERRFKPVPSAIATAPIPSQVAGGPEWDARMAAIALRVVRTELEARALSEPPVG